MAIKKIYELANERSGSQSVGGFSAVRSYHVTTDIADSPIFVLINGYKGDPSGIKLPTIGSAHPEHRTLTCQSITPNMLEPGEYRVEVSYQSGSLTDGEDEEKLPWEYGAYDITISSSTEQFTPITSYFPSDVTDSNFHDKLTPSLGVAQNSPRIIKATIGTGIPIQNSANDFFDPIPTADKIKWQLSFKYNKRYLDIKENLITTSIVPVGGVNVTSVSGGIMCYLNSINHAAVQILGLYFPKHTCKLSSLTMTPRTLETSNPISRSKNKEIYFVFDVKIDVDPDTYITYLLDAGYNATSYVDGRKYPIRIGKDGVLLDTAFDANSEPVSRPQLLDGAGRLNINQLSSQDLKSIDLYFCKFVFNRRLDWSLMKFPSDISVSDKGPGHGLSDRYTLPWRFNP